MFIASFPAGPWQTNCYLVATEPGAECVVIDPGMDALAGIEDLVAEHRLKPTAVMLTHGHLDHMFSVAPLCRSEAAACWIHPDDRSLLGDPLRAMSADTAALLARLGGGRAQFTEPDDVRELHDGVEVAIAGVSFEVLHAPGHTPGSVMFATGDNTAQNPRTRPGRLNDNTDGRVVFSGDVLFAGSIGRTDLPGGNHPDMLRSLRSKVLPLPDAAVILPGHGPETTMARERVVNPYLQELM